MVVVVVVIAVVVAIVGAFLGWHAVLGAFWAFGELWGCFGEPWGPFCATLDVLRGFRGARGDV